MTTVTTGAPDVEVIDPLSAAFNKLLKPGSRTSEFIALVAIYGGSLATLLGAFNTSSPRFNAILKVAALVAAAAGQVGYALSRGDAKQALATVTATLAASGVTVPIVSSPAKHAKDAGVANLTLIGAVLLIVGVILCLAAGSFVVLVIGLIVAVLGFILLLGGGPYLRRRF